MIPYFNVTFPSIGPVTIHLFGVLVACGIVAGSRLTRDRGQELGLDDEMVSSMITTVLVCGFLFSHFFDVVAYQTAEDPLFSLGWWKHFINPFAGLSSYGGFIGALGGLFLWTRYAIDLQRWSVAGPIWLPRLKFERRATPEPVMPYADSLGFGLAAGWTFGRLGCFSAHDHPGHLSNFFLAVKYPGGARHDLGLDEALWSLMVTSAFLIMKKRGNQPLGIYVAILTIAYAPIRFLLDFLRATDMHGADPRYFGLTPGQYGSILVLFAGLGLVKWTMVHAREQKALEATKPTKAKAKSNRGK